MLQGYNQKKNIYIKLHSRFLDLRKVFHIDLIFVEVVAGGGGGLVCNNM
jgi:hypothetical protein